MNSKKISAIIVLVVLFVVGLLHVMNAYLGIQINSIVLSISHLLLCLSFIYYAILKKNLTTWILISMVIGALIGHEFPVIGQNMRVLSKYSSR